MITLKIDMLDIINLKRSVDLIEERRMPSLTVAVNNSVVSVRDRIDKGVTASGKIMQTKSKKTDGKYSKVWGKFRRKKGLTVDRVTLSYTGVTRGNFKVLNDFNAFKNDSVTVSFATDEADLIASYNNEMFGNAYDYSDKEIEETFTDYRNEFNSELTRI